MSNNNVTNEPDRMTVLLVDDDHDVLAANARFLRVNEIEVIVADCASIAMTRLSEHEIDVIVTDLRMPNSNGLEFAKQARVTRPLIPIVFFSGYAQVPDVVAAMKLGAVEFLEKPVDPDELLNILRSVRRTHHGSLISQRYVFDETDHGFSLKMRVLAYEKYLIESTMLQHSGNMSSVRKSLQINKRTLNDKIFKLGIKRELVLKLQARLNDNDQD